MNSLTARVSSLAAACALALHALLSATTLPLPLTAQLANAPARAVICSGTSGADQPVDHDRAPCTLHCLLVAGCGAGGWAPSGSGIVALFAPAEIRISLPKLARTPGRATTKSPQLPRAPPLA